TGAQLKGKNEFVVTTGGQKHELKSKQDFVPFSFSSSSTGHASFVFVGYGVTADEFHYDAYAGIHVKDKSGLALRYEPPSFAGKAGKQGMPRHAQLITKGIN